MKNTFFALCLCLPLFSGNVFASGFGEKQSKATIGKDKIVHKFAEKFKLLVAKRTQSVARLTPQKFAQKFKNQNDRRYFLRLARSTRFKRFPRATFRKGVYSVNLPLGHKLTYSALNVAQGIFFIDNHSFQVKKGESFWALSLRLKSFLQTKLKSTTQLEWSDFLIGRAYAKADISDILMVHASGYISINYDEGGAFTTESGYAEELYNSLKEEINSALAECQNLGEDIKGYGKGLTTNITSILDSLKDKSKKYDDYAIISSLLKKYSKKTAPGNSPYVAKNTTVASSNILKAFDSLSNPTKCHALVGVMLPDFIFSTTRTKYKDGVCSGLTKLKSCYVKLDNIHDRRVSEGTLKKRVGTMEVLEELPSADSMAQ